MKIIVYFTLGDVLECEDVKNSRKFWRMVSKYCKHISNSYLAYNLDGRRIVQRVVRVVKEV